MSAILRFCFSGILALTAFGITPAMSMATEGDQAREASIWIDNWMRQMRDEGDRHLLGLTKEQLLKHFPPHLLDQPGWHHSKDLTEFTSTLIDHVVLIEVRFRAGRVYKVRDSWFNVGDSRIHYGKWLVASKSSEKK